MLINQLLINNAKIGLIFILASTIEKIFYLMSYPKHLEIMTTQICLSHFDNKQVDEAMRYLM